MNTESNVSSEYITRLFLAVIEAHGPVFAIDHLIAAINEMASRNQKLNQMLNANKETEKALSDLLTNLSSTLLAEADKFETAFTLLLNSVKEGKTE